MRQTPSSNTISNAYIIHPILDSVQNSLKSLNLFLGYSFSVSHDPKILATFLHRSNNPHSSNQKYIISCKWTFGISYGDSSLWAIKRTCKGVAHLWLQACRQWNSQTTMGPSTHKLFFRQQMDKMEVLNTLSICIKKNMYMVGPQSASSIKCSFATNQRSDLCASQSRLFKCCLHYEMEYSSTTFCVQRLIIFFLII